MLSTAASVDAPSSNANDGGVAGAWIRYADDVTCAFRARPPEPPPPPPPGRRVKYSVTVSSAREWESGRETSAADAAKDGISLRADGTAVARVAENRSKRGRVLHVGRETGATLRHSVRRSKEEE